MNALDEVIFPRPLAGLFRPLLEAMFEEQAAVLALIKRLKWKQILVIADQTHVLTTFGEAAAQDDICVVANILVNTNKY